MIIEGQTKPRLILAPMEGVVDAIMREQLTAIGGYERCVTEFVRVSQTLLPNRVFYRYAPELRQGGLTVRLGGRFSKAGDDLRYSSELGAEAPDSHDLVRILDIEKSAHVDSGPMKIDASVSGAMEKG